MTHSRIRSLTPFFTPLRLLFTVFSVLTSPLETTFFGVAPSLKPCISSVRTRLFCLHNSIQTVFNKLTLVCRSCFNIREPLTCNFFNMHFLNLICYVVSLQSLGPQSIIFEFFSKRVIFPFFFMYITSTVNKQLLLDVPY